MYLHAPLGLYGLVLMLVNLAASALSIFVASRTLYNPARRRWLYICAGFSSSVAGVFFWQWVMYGWRP